MKQVMNVVHEVINKQIANEIAFNLGILEDANFSSSQVQMVRKMLWKVHNETVKLMNDCDNDKSNKS